MAIGIVVVALLFARLSTGASADRFTLNTPMPPGMHLQAADDGQISALKLGDAAVIAAARDGSPGFVGKSPLIRVGVVISDDAAAGRYGVPATPTLSWILVSPDVAVPVSVPEGTDGEVVSQVGFAFLDASGTVYHSVLLSYFKGDALPALPAQ